MSEQHGWIIADSHGDAGAFHQADPVPRRSVTFHTVAAPTLVLGSAQRDEAVDQAVTSTIGVDVVRRRSGGGAVLLLPGEFLWADVTIPVDDPLWKVDVAQAMVWVGEWWRAALASLGVAGEVHRGAMVASEWSREVCWTGIGTGEVMSSGAKLVGVSQRRTRQLARFQTMCHLRWRPELVSALVGPPRPTAGQVASAAATVPSSAEAVRAALLAALPPRQH
jgi:lipoate-protein ligase A